MANMWVKTVAGWLYIHSVGTPDSFPGVYVEKVAGEGETYGKLLTVVEYDQTKGAFQTCVYDGGSDEPAFVHHHTGRIPDEAFKSDLRHVMSHAISTDYMSALLDSDRFYNAVKTDVEETSGWYDEQTYNHDDIRLAIGRVLCSVFAAEE